MSRKTATYHIIGGGISGLATAKFLKQKNPYCKTIVYEAAAHPGGRAWSFYDERLGRSIDNATHVILGANKNILSLMNEAAFSGMPVFYADNKCSKNFLPHFSHILLSVFNTPAKKIPIVMLRKLAIKLFPFFPKKLKIYFSKGNLAENLITPLLASVDEFKTGCCLQNIKTEKERITTLCFKQTEVSLSPQDIVISAVDAANYSKIFGGDKFEFNEITNIFFRTSQALTLPGNTDFLATPQLASDWIFINGDITAVTISDSSHLVQNDEALARQVWIEIRGINSIYPSFLPPYRVIRHKRATIRQDIVNNLKRPTSANGKYTNLRIAGDWTMRDYPASLEAAVLSAQKAAKS